MNFFLRLENFDIERAKEACKLFVGLRDFQTFAAVNKGDRKIQYRREISKLTIEKATSLLPVDSLSENFNFWHVRCKARSFLHNQVFKTIIIKNFKNSKPLESSKYKKHDQIWTKITTLNKKP